MIKSHYKYEFLERRFIVFRLSDILSQCWIQGRDYKNYHLATIAVKPSEIQKSSTIERAIEKSNLLWFIFPRRSSAVRRDSAGFRTAATGDSVRTSRKSGDLRSVGYGESTLPTDRIFSTFSAPCRVRPRSAGSVRSPVDVGRSSRTLFSKNYHKNNYLSACYFVSKK